MSAPKLGELGPEARRRYDAWRTIGLSESAAMQALRDDGLLQESAHDRAVEVYRSLGLSDAAAEVAASGRDGVRRPLSERSGDGDLQANVDALKRKVIELAETYMHQGEPELRAYERAARQVLDASRSGQLLWTVANILEGWRPGVTGMKRSAAASRSATVVPERRPVSKTVREG